MKRIIISLIFLYSFTSLAFKNDLAVKGGVSYSWANIKTMEGEDDNREDGMTAGGFNTHVAYRWDNFETSLSSYIFWGDVDGMKFRAQGEDIEGDASYRHVSFGPIARYTIKALPIYRNWYPYFGLGPSISLQTIKMDEPRTNGSFNSRQKLTYESYGGFVMIGVEERLEFKEMHPVYIEFLYSYKKSREVSVVDSTDPTETNILSTEESKQDLSGHFFMLSIGLTLF